MSAVPLTELSPQSRAPRPNSPANWTNRHKDINRSVSETHTNSSKLTNRDEKHTQTIVYQLSRAQ